MGLRQEKEPQNHQKTPLANPLEYRKHTNIQTNYNLSKTKRSKDLKQQHNQSILDELLMKSIPHEREFKQKKKKKKLMRNTVQGFIKFTLLNKIRHVTQPAKDATKL